MSVNYKFKFEIDEKVLIDEKSTIGTVKAIQINPSEEEIYFVEFNDGGRWFNESKLVSLKDIDLNQNLFKFDIGDTVMTPAGYLGVVSKRCETQDEISYKVTIQENHTVTVMEDDLEK